MGLPVYFPPGYGTHTFTWQCDDNGINASCSFAFQNVPNLTAEEAADALNDIWLITGRPGGNAGLSDQWRRVGTYTLLQRVGYQDSYTSTDNVPGISMTASPAAVNSIVINKRTLRAGKRYRGRFAWPAGFVAEEDVDAGGNIASPKVVILQGRFDAALDAMTTASLPLVLLHTRLTIDESPLPTAVIELNVNPLMGVQRKRSGR